MIDDDWIGVDDEDGVDVVVFGYYFVFFWVGFCVLMGVVIEVLLVMIMLWNWLKR